MQIEVRILDALDLESVAQLFVACFNGSPWNENWEQEVAYNRLLDVQQANGFIGLVAIVDTEIVGAALGNLEYWYEGKNYQLKEMFISPRVQGTGCGSKILNALEEVLITYGVTKQTLMTLNTPRTIAFYEKNGFEVDNNLVYMQK